MKKAYYIDRHNISGDRIHELRIKRRYSQAQVAAKVQLLNVAMEQDTISRIECGQRIVTDYELCALANALGVRITDLLEQEDRAVLLGSK